MNKTPIKFDSNGIYASSEKLREIALLCLEREKAIREARLADNGQWGNWNISDRD